MYITVRKALQLKRFKEFKLLCGERGLDRKIEKISLLDHEIVDPLPKQFFRNEFALSSLLGAKSDSKLILKSVKYLNESGVSGLGVKNVYYDILPDEVISYGNENNFPIFIFDNSVFFEDIITDVRDVLRDLEKSAAFEDRINHILNTSVSEDEISDYFYQIIGFLKKPYQLIYFKEKENLQERDILSIIERFRNEKIESIKSIFKFGSGFIMAYSTDNYRDALFKADLAYLNINLENYCFGRSLFFQKSSDFKLAVRQSIWSARIAELRKVEFIDYNDVGIYKLIIPYADTEIYREYMSEIIEPIKNYDKKHGTELLSTAKIFVENEGHIVETARALHQHNNTIRYRIAKIKEILGMENFEGQFYEHLSLAFRINKLRDAKF